MNPITWLAASMMRRRRHQTLIFHRVLDEHDPMSPHEPTAAWFRRLIGMLSANFQIISVTEAIRRAEQRELTGNTISITFDDGYADNFATALPILQEFAAPATFFVSSGFLDGGRMWNDSIIETIRRLDPGTHAFELANTTPLVLSDWGSRRDAAATVIAAWKHLPPAERQGRVDDLARHVADLPDDLMMTSAQLRALAAQPGVTIGGHTRTHPILASLPEAEAGEEIAGGKQDLEDCLQRELTLFAYPNGKRGQDYGPAHLELARHAGFSAALATNWGFLDAATERFEIPRFTPWHTDLTRFSIDLARCHHGLI